MDILPTAAALGRSGTPAPVVEGVDLLPYLSGETPGAPHEWLFWRQGKRGALMHGDWKLVSHSLNADNPNWALFNVANDIAESENLAENSPEKLRELIAIWHEKNGEMREPLFR